MSCFCFYFFCFFCFFFFFTSVSASAAASAVSSDSASASSASFIAAPSVSILARVVAVAPLFCCGFCGCLRRQFLASISPAPPVTAFPATAPFVTTSSGTAPSIASPFSAPSSEIS